MLDLSNHFVYIDFSGFSPVEFPLDFTNSHQLNVSYLWAINGPAKTLSLDFIEVPMCLQKAEIASSATKLITLAGIDNGIVVSGGNGFDMYTISEAINKHEKNNRYPISMYFQDGDLAPDVTNMLGVYQHPVDMTDINDFYISMIGNKIEPNTRLFISVSGNINQFVMPYKNDTYGLAILDNKSVVLGTYNIVQKESEAPRKIKWREWL